VLKPVEHLLHRAMLKVPPADLPLPRADGDNLMGWREGDIVDAPWDSHSRPLDCWGQEATHFLTGGRDLGRS